MAKKFGGLVHQWAVDQRLASPLDVAHAMKSKMEIEELREKIEDLMNDSIDEDQDDDCCRKLS